VAVWDEFSDTGLIGIYGLDGARQVQLAMPEAWNPSGDHDPVFTSDGSAVRLDDVVLPLDGGAPQQVAPGSYDWNYSPDGSMVAYPTHRSLTVARADGSDAREVFGDWASDPTWSPAGDRIAFVSGSDSPTPTAELRILDVATGSTTLVVEGKPRTVFGMIGFSPDGGRFLFSQIEDRGKGEPSLWSVDLDGSDLQLVVEGTAEGDWLTP
jgi:Tol biopolymer transport system component